MHTDVSGVGIGVPIKEEATAGIALVKDQDEVRHGGFSPELQGSSKAAKRSYSSLAAERNAHKAGIGKHGESLTWKSLSLSFKRFFVTSRPARDQFCICHESATCFKVALDSAKVKLQALETLVFGLALLWEALHRRSEHPKRRKQAIHNQRISQIEHWVCSQPSHRPSRVYLHRLPRIFRG